MVKYAITKPNYSAISNNMKLVHWSLMNGLLRNYIWYREEVTGRGPCCTKCNSPPISSQCTNYRIAV